MSSQSAFAECGVASHYSEGSRTATGERYNHLGVSAAHKTLPFGSIVRVTHRRTGRSVEVRINDRGPFVRGRIIDLSTGAKRALGMDGLAPVCLDVVSYGHGRKGRVIEASNRHRSPDVFGLASGDGDEAADRPRSARHGRRHIAHVYVRGTKHAERSYSRRARHAKVHHRGGRKMAQGHDTDSES